MKKNVMIRLSIFLFIAVMLTICSVSGTFAKYVSQASGSDSARVAKWTVKVGTTDITQTDTFTIDLFKDTYVDGTTTYVDGKGEKVVAPGTEGEFALAINNASEVLADYTIDYTITNNDSIPIKFSIDGGATWTDSLSDITTAKQIAIDATDTVNVLWKWDEASTDAADTALGIAGTATITVEAKITVNQVVKP